MKNIFLTKRAKKSRIEKAISWIVAFSMVLQGSYLLPLTAYATYTKIVAYKVVCDNESDLPNWGAGGPDINANTVSTFLSAHPHCHVQSGWKFQYAPSGTANPGDSVALAASPWVTSAATDATGKTSWDAYVPNFGDRIWVREVPNASYIPFSGVGSTSTVSAEMYCHNDVLNYDNYDTVLNPQIGGTYYCVAFNVLKPTTPPVNQKPVITVGGLNPTDVVVGTLYVDASATVQDPEDGNITNKLITTGTVNTNVIGTYTITYNATDSQNLAADTKTRTVNVVPAPACLAPVDVMLVIDRSGSMKDDGTNPEQPLTQAKQGSNGFIDTLKASTDKAGVVTYSSSATLNSALSSNFTAVKASYASVTANGSTNIAAAITKATTEMSTNGRSGTKHVMVLLSDGVPNVSGMTVAQASADAVAKAATAKSLGTVIYTIGLGTGVNPTLMKQIASTPTNYYFSPSGAELETIYKTIAVTECQRDPATVSGRKINDDNANGTIDQGEVGIADWHITLTEVGGNGLTLDATTNANGAYSFADVVPGNYLLCEVSKEGWRETFPSTSVNNGCYLLNLDPGATITNKDFLNTESNKPQCRDGKDNDGDGKIDYPADPGCDNSDDNDENQKPVITVVGTDPVTVTLGETYVDQSATVADPEDGDITNKLVTLGTVNTGTVGNYTITYNATDSKNVAAVEKTRTVHVVAACADGKDNDGDGKTDFAGGDTGCDNPNDNDENDPPAITLLGTDPMSVTQGTTFTDPGATALDKEDGDITTHIVVTGTVDTNTVGDHVLHYNVVDSKGLPAPEKTRVVKVTPPVTECNDGIDNDGDNHIDFAGHVEGDMAFVPDAGCDSPEDNDENEKPVITIVGNDPLEVHLGTVFTDPSATVADPEEGDITSKLVTTGTVDTNTLGSYTLNYDAQDSKGLAAVTKHRVVKVITSCSDGKDNDGDNLVDFPADPGCGSPEDDSENSKPVITLLGDVLMNLTVGTTYTEPSATVADAEDGNITSKLIIAGTVNTNTVGSYTVTYNATDSQDLAADQVIRTVKVNPATCTENCGGTTPPACSDGADNDGDDLADFPRDPGCDSPQDNDERDSGPTLTLTGDNPMNITAGTSFVDPGATAHDPEEGDITSRIVVTGTVDANTVGAYVLTYNVSDAQGHAATPVTRTVNVNAAACTTNCGGGSGTSPYPGCIDPNATNYNRLANKDDGSCTYPGGGGGSVTLSIFNEKLEVTGTSSVTVTWSTNLPADSRVVYGLDSVPTLGTAPLYGYSLTTATDSTMTTSHSMVINGIPSAVTTHYRPVSATDSAHTVVGIELHREPAGGVPEACFYLREYMRLGANNNPVEVTKLQSFLRNFEGFSNLEITGFFDVTTDAAVRAFQDRYASDVLTPWNLPGNTGYVYYTTQKKVNEIYCKRAFPLSETQIAEVNAFKQLINTIGSQGGNAPTLPLVGTNVTNGETAGAVAGAATENGGAIGGGVATDKTGIDVKKRGRIALSDLLATVPHVGNELDKSGPTVTVTPADEQPEGVVAGASTKRGLAAVVESMSDKLSICLTPLTSLIAIIVAVIALVVVYIVARKRAKREEMAP